MKNRYSQQWREIPWEKFKRNLFRLQKRLWKAMRAGDKKRALNLQKLILRSRSARFLAIRQVTQLNQGKKTAGVDGKKKLSFKERILLEKEIAKNWKQWKHQKLREIPIPKKDGTTRMLKVPTIADRAWQCLIKYAIEPAHEAIFHARSYGFRPGRSTHDAQKYIFDNLKSHVNGINKKILELDIEKCFDRIKHESIMERIIAPQVVKQRLRQCLTSGVNPEFPHQGTPQGGVISPLLANIALDGIENIHKSVRYADDMVVFIKPDENADEILTKIKEFLAQRGLNIKQSKTRLVFSTDGFDFLGWHFRVQENGKFRSVPSEENFQKFRKKVKEIVNSSDDDATTKARLLAPIIRGWRNYHKYGKMDGKYNLYFLRNQTHKVFNKEKKQNRYSVDNLGDRAFPTIPYSENKFVMVKGDYSPFNGDLVYWSKRNSKLYDGQTAKTLNKQHHTCGHCGLKLIDGEKVHLHHIDGNHDNWKANNLMAVHKSCHDYIHMSNR